MVWVEWVDVFPDYSTLNRRLAIRVVHVYMHVYTCSTTVYNIIIITLTPACTGLEVVSGLCP